MLDMRECSNQGEVGAYLREHLGAAAVLPELRERARDHFGSDARVALRVVVDTEAENSRELFALIETPLHRARARTVLRRLDDDWWLDALDGVECGLVVDIEYDVSRGGSGCAVS